MQTVHFVLPYIVLMARSWMLMGVGLVNVTVSSVDFTASVINLMVNVFVIMDIIMIATQIVSKVKLLLLNRS